MGRESCIKHSDGGRFIKHHEDYYVITGYDKGMTVVLAHLEYLTNGKIANMKSAGRTGDPWVTVSAAEMVDDMVGYMTEKPVREALQTLAKTKWVQVRSGEIGDTRSYLLVVSEINQSIKDAVSKRLIPFTGKITGAIELPLRSAVNLPVENQLFSGNFTGQSAVFSGNFTGLKEEEEVVKKNTTTNTAPAAQDVDASAKDESQNPDARQEAQTQTQGAPGLPQMGVEPLDADTARAEITGIYRVAKGAKRPKWNTKQGAANLEKLASLLEDLGYDTVIAAIHAYVTTFKPDAAFLKDKPLDWILTRERILKFAGETTMPRRETPAAPDASAPPRTAPTTPRVSSELARSLDTLLKPASEIKAPGFRDPDVLGFWNATMPPQCQAPVMTTGLKQFLVACSSEPEFGKRWRDLVKLAAQVAASGKPKFKLTLSWFLRDGWAKLANHEFDWALPEGAPVSGETPAEDAGEPYGVMDRDAIESAITAMTRLPFITPERRDIILDERETLRREWNANGGEEAFRAFALFIRRHLNRAEQAVWFPRISHVAQKRLVEVVEKFKI